MAGAGDTDLSGYAQLNAANTFTAANTFNSNIVVRAATAAGSAGVITLGEKPSSKTAQCLINAAGNGNLILQASENGIVGLQSGSVLQWSVISDEANTKTSAYLHSNLAATYTPATGVVWEGNANTATKLATARTINGVPFDGTKDIDIIVVESVNGIKPTNGNVTIDVPKPDIASITPNYNAGVSVGASFTAPNIGWILGYFWIVGEEDSYACVNDKGIAYEWGDIASVQILVNKGDVFTTTGTSLNLTFYPCKGA